MWFLPPLCLPVHKDSDRSLNPAALIALTLAHSRIPRGSSYLVPSVSQSVWRQSAGVLIFSLEGGRERKCSWNVMIMWFRGEWRRVATTGENPLLGQRLEVIWSHRGRRNRGYKLIYWNQVIQYLFLALTAELKWLFSLMFYGNTHYFLQLVRDDACVHKRQTFHTI